MKKVLIIAFYFPPLGGGGVQRTLKFTKYLKSFGWEPIVLTIEPYFFNYIRDNSLLKELDPNTKIYRSRYIHLRGLPLINGAIYKPIQRHLLIPDSESMWNSGAVKKALKIIKEENIDLLFTTCPPYSINLIGKELKKKTGLPWICDLRDEWTTDDKREAYFKRMSQKRFDKEFQMEHECFSAADKLITVSDVAKRKLAKVHTIDSEKFEVITNGYDSVDFTGYSYQQPEQGNKLKMVHMGDLSTRDFKSFLTAVKNLNVSGKIPKEKLEINFITSSSPRWVKKYYDESCIKFTPYMDHNKLLKEIGNYHLLLLVIGNNEPAIVSGKLFEYLHAKRSIFAVAPKNGAASNIINQCDAGIISSPDDVSEIEANLLNQYQLWEKGLIEYSGKEAEISKYDRKTLTESLSKLFNTQVGE